jgi:D-alanyl-D-alanine carboxypeptidase
MSINNALTVSLLALFIMMGCSRNDQKGTEYNAYRDIKEKLERMVLKDKNLKHALLLVHSDTHDFHWKFAFGTTGIEQKPITSDDPYHIASIGKTFTSIVIARLYERGEINYEDPISKYLSPEMLENLFVYKGKDYSEEVLVRHLLNHTSGIADYWEDKPVKGKSIKEMVIEEPERFWKPEDTVDHTRYNQKAVSSPGKKFHYSDTGYNLLGKIIEEITKKSFHENLHDEIFDPLGMVNSYLLYRSEPKEKGTYPILDTFIDKHEVSGFKSISVDWAGGGIVSTTEDLLLFHKALVNNRLIKDETFELLTKDVRWFGFGMDYGYGLLLLNIGKMTIVLPKELNMWGNFGSIGAYMFYNPAYDVYIVGSFNHSNYIRKQVGFIIKVIRTISKM